jgi:hypothetical protein
MERYSWWLVSPVVAFSTYSSVFLRRNPRKKRERSWKANPRNLQAVICSSHKPNVRKFRQQASKEKK